MTQTSIDDRTLAATPIRDPVSSAQPLGRRGVLRIASGGIAALAAAILAACDKPYYDRNRGLIVVRRHDK